MSFSRILALAAMGVMAVPQVGLLFRREVFRNLNGFDLKYRFSSDFDFVLRARLAGFEFSNRADLRMGAFRLHPLQISQRKRRELVAETRCSIQRNKFSVSRIGQWIALFRLRLSNWDSYVVRILRRRQLKGVWKLPTSLSID